MGLKFGQLPDVKKKTEYLRSQKNVDRTTACVLSVPRPSWVSAPGPKRLEMVGYFSKCSCLHCMRKKIQWIAGNFEILGQCS